jgi:hypothetical protein
VVDFSGGFALSDWLMLLSQHSLALRLLFPSFPADSADSKQLDSNSLESIEIESIAQIPTPFQDSGMIKSILNSKSSTGRLIIDVVNSASHVIVLHLAIVWVQILSRDEGEVRWGVCDCQNNS